MRKWIAITDIVLLVFCLALLLVDLQIKNAIVEQAKALEAALNGAQRPAEHDNIHNSLPGDILPNYDDDKSALEVPVDVEPGTEGTRPRKGRTTAAKRNSGNNGAGVLEGHLDLGAS
jgi:hypothetical protein